MEEARKIRSIAISGLQEMFDYRIEFVSDGRTAILIAPNGYGKTAFLAVLNSCLQFRLFEAAEHRFNELNVTFDDNTRWSFKKVPYTDDPHSKEQRDLAYRAYARQKRRSRYQVRFTLYDDKGKPKNVKGFGGIESIPPHILARALDRNLPVKSISYELFRDMRTGDSVRPAELIERYKDVLLADADFQEQIGDYAPALFEGVDSRLHCVFIETQRLLQSHKPDRTDAEVKSGPQEEILRQSDYLAKLLQRTYASYAATSQDLDRSFPNRLIARSEGAGPYDVQGIKEELNNIESRRKALTAAGILVDTAELLVAPKDEFIRNVADALQIYVEDSKQKLATFDEVYAKISVFNDLLSKKLRPKELVINRESGAEVRRGRDPVGLDKLSSGEKHEFIMLFRLIFETPPGSLVLIDEPEISLHVSWQLEFMPDLARIQSANSFQCIIATHSPQIIQGAEDITFDLSEQAA